MKSFRQMTADGMLKRADAEKIELHNIHFEPGFNPPGRSDIPDSEPLDELDQQLYDHIMETGVSQLPQWEVRPRPEGGVYVVEGHRRTMLVRRAIADGLDLADKRDGKIWIPIKQFMGNDEERMARVVTSNRRKELTPMQLAEHFKKWRSLGRNPQQIADKAKLSRTTIEQYLRLADSNLDVQTMIEAGDVSATLAGAVVREHGEAAGAVLATAKVKAQAAGKKRVTAAALSKKPKPFTHPNLVRAQHNGLAVTLTFDNFDAAFVFFENAKGK